MVANELVSESLAQLPLPPSERDFDLYGLVVTEGASTRAAAQAFGLLQTRVIQIRDRVADWIASEVSPLARATPAQRLALAAEIALNRFDFLYSQALDAWRGSKGPQTIRRGGLNGETTSTCESQGEPRYLMAAARIAERTVGLGAKIERAVAEPGSKIHVSGSKLNGRETVDPPVGDCSLSAAGDEEPTQVEQQVVAASASQVEVSDENRRRRRDFLGEPKGVFEDCSASPLKLPGSAAQPSRKPALR